MDEVQPLIDVIGQKLVKVEPVGYNRDGIGVEFPEAVILTFENGVKINIDYVVYPEGSSYLQVRVW